MGEVVNLLVGVFSGIIGTAGGGVSGPSNYYANPVQVKESKTMPWPYVYLALTVLLLIVSIFALTRKK